MQEETLNKSESNDGTEKDGGIGSWSGGLRIRKSWNEWSLNCETLINTSITSNSVYYILHQVFAKDAKREQAIKVQEGKNEVELDSIID